MKIYTYRPSRIHTIHTLRFQSCLDNRDRLDRDAVPEPFSRSVDHTRNEDVAAHPMRFCCGDYGIIRLQGLNASKYVFIY